MKPSWLGHLSATSCPSDSPRDHHPHHESSHHWSAKDRLNHALPLRLDRLKLVLALVAGVAVLCWHPSSATELGRPALTPRFESSGKQSPPPVRSPQTDTSRAEPLFSQSLAGVRPPLNRSNSHALFGTCLGILGIASKTEPPLGSETPGSYTSLQIFLTSFLRHHLFAQPQPDSLFSVTRTQHPPLETRNRLPL